MADLASPSELAEYSKGTISQSEPRITGALAGVSAAIRNYCGWHITPVVTQELVLDGPGGRLLNLPTNLLTGITALTEDGVLLVDNTDFRWSADGSVKRKGCTWSDDFRIITATIVHGYAEAPDVKRVALAVVARELSSPTGATREQAGAVSISWALSSAGVSGGVALLQNERDILDHYRIESA